MKQKFNALLFSCLILLFGTTTQQLNAQTQLKGWHMAPNLIDLKTATPTIRPAFTKNNATPGSNSIYDSEGKLLFYISNFGQIFNKFDQLIGTLPVLYVGTTEIAIVPNPYNGACVNKYFVIYAAAPPPSGSDFSGKIRCDEVDMNSLSGRGQYTQNTTNYGITGLPAAPLAVSKLVNVSGVMKRFVYFTNTIAQIEMRELTASGMSATPFSIPVNINGFTSDLELSNNGDKLAYASGNTLGSIEVLPLNPATGLSSGSPFVFTTIAGAGNNIRGLEFNNAGNKLFYSISTSGIYVKDLITPFNVTPITTTYKNCMLEKNYNGTRILCADASNIVAIDVASPYSLGTPVPCTLPTINNGLGNFVLMPDQIDGENYDATNTKNVDVDIYTVPTSATWFTTVNPFWLMQQNTYLGTLTSFQKVRVARQINIPNAISVNIDKMTFEFHTNAELNVNGGGNLTLSGALLQGHPCGLMWRGVSVNNNASSNASNFIMTTAFINSRIYDAIKGVEVNGSNVTVNINTNSSFDKNEKGVVLNSVNPSIVSITGSRFYSTIPLIDQTKGQVLTTSGTVRYGITGIEANTSGTSANKLKIGSVTTGNTFKSGQYGIRSLRTDILIQKNNFQDADVTAVSADANFMGPRETDVLDNTFLNNNTDTWVVFGCNQVAKRNTFTNTNWNSGVYLVEIYDTITNKKEISKFIIE